MSLPSAANLPHALWYPVKGTAEKETFVSKDYSKTDRINYPTALYLLTRTGSLREAKWHG